VLGTDLHIRNDLLCIDAYELDAERRIETVHAHGCSLFRHETSA
jgi:hypothetical protein